MVSPLHDYLAQLIDALDVPTVDDAGQRLLCDRVGTVLACLRNMTAGGLDVEDLSGDAARLRAALAATDDRVAELRAERAMHLADRIQDGGDR